MDFIRISLHFTIKDSMIIDVVGGGAVGVELAGDIMNDKAEVYLIHLRENLVNDQVSESLQSTVKAKLTSLGVNKILDMKGSYEYNLDGAYRNAPLITKRPRNQRSYGY